MYATTIMPIISHHFRAAKREKCNQVLKTRADLRGYDAGGWQRSAWK